MNRLAKLLLLSSVAALLSAMPGHGQSAYSNAVMSLSPVGYWPMHENEAMTHGDIETNYGSAGPLANGFYGDWVAPGVIQHDYVPGAIAGDPNPCMYFDYQYTGTSGNMGSPTNCLIIPHTSPYATLVPPFTIELWYLFTNNVAQGRQSDIWAQGGNAGLNGGNLNGIRLYFNNTLVVYTYNNGVSTTSPTSTQKLGAWDTGTWNHIVVTDDGTYIQVYLDGVNVITNWPNANYSPDYWDPLEIDTGKQYSRDASGLIDEVAIYTNALSPSDITNHYYTALNPAPAVSYKQLVLNDNPTIYYRMDSPSYSEPSSATLPALANYGSSGVNGLYSPGTMPAGVAGPNNGTTFAYGFAASTNAMPGSGLSSFADAGTSTSYNPTGTGANFSIAAWFQTDPADSRVQTIISHGTNSWGITLNTAGLIVFNPGTNNAAEGTGTAAGDLASPNQYNDGFWHYVVATHGGGSNTLYLDGNLVATNISTGSIPGHTGDVFIGSDPSYTNNPVALGRQFEGNVCEGAMFNSVLTPGQIQSLYNAGEMAPAINSQPVSAAANQGVAFTNTAAAIGALPLAYQWYTNGVAIAGQTGASLVLNPVTPGDAGTNYYVVVTNSYGSVTSAVVNLSVNTSPVINGQFPVTYTNVFPLYAGASPTFSLLASGAAPLYYQWITNGIADGAATNASFTLTNVQAGQPITNYCIVSNSLGEATSMVWNASVIADPVNNNIAGNPPAPFPTNILLLNPIGYWRLNDANNGGGNDGAIAIDYAGGNNGIYTNVVLGQEGYDPTADPSDTSVGVGSSSYPTNGYASYVGTNIDFAVASGVNAEFSVEAWVNLATDTSVGSPQGSGIVCKGVPNGGEEFALDTTASETFRFFVRSANGTQYSATPANVPSTGVWYHLVGVCDEANGKISLYVDGQLAGSATIPTGSGIYNGSAINLTIGSRSILPAAISEQMFGDLNDVAVFNYALTSNQVVNLYYSVGLPPFITQQPSSSYVGQGSNATAVATVIGTPSLDYQWYETNLTAMTGFAVTGQTNALLVISNVVSSGDYYLEITNAYGATNSAVVAITVYASPVITGSLPVPYTNVFTLYAGANPRFSVSALGLGTLSYYWLTNGVVVGGAAGTNLALTSVQAGFLTNCCIVSNSVGWTSNVWVAQVIPVPAAPYPQSVLALNPIGYWRMNDTNLDGVDGNDVGSIGSGNGDVGDSGYICHDYAGGNDGIYTNCTLNNPGYNPAADPSDSSAQFGSDPDGSSDFGDSLAYAIAGINFGATNTSVAFTVEAWASGYPQTSDAGIVTLGYGSGGEQLDLDTGSDGITNVSHGFRFLIRDASGGSHAVSSSIQPSGVPNNFGPWYHLAGVVDEAHSNMVFYIDGLPVGTASLTPNSGVLASTYLMGIGSRLNPAASSYSSQFLGEINDVAVFNYALSAGQVVNEYTAGGGTVAPFFSPTPATSASAAANSTLTIPVTAVGTPPLSFWWTNVTTSTAIETGATNTSAALNASLNYANVPISWNGDTLEVTVSNAYGMTNVFLTLTITNGVNPNPTNIVFGVTNNQLTLSWPPDHTGWQLQAQTNSLAVGISANWVNVAGSTGTNKVVIPVNLTNGSVFYRLTY